MKNIFYCLMLFLFLQPFSLYAQKKDSIKNDTAFIQKNKKSSFSSPVHLQKKDSLHKDTSPVQKISSSTLPDSNPPHQINMSAMDSAAIALAKADSLRADSLRKAGLLLKNADSLMTVRLHQQSRDSLYASWLKGLLIHNLFFLHTEKRIADPDRLHHTASQDYLFYLLAGMLLLLALIRVSYYKYFGNIFRAFFRPTLSNRQLKDQLLQASYPSLLLNLFFCISLGIYLFLLLRYFHYIVAYNAFLLISVLVMLVIIIYVVKYVLLRISGWLFGNRELAASYIFIFFLLNKITGVLLVPFLILLAFCAAGIASFSFYLSVIIIALLLGYRYIRLYGLIRNYIFFSRFHFFLYLCAFEIAPVLLIAKVVLIWLNGNG